MAENEQVSVEDLAKMPEDERVQWFLAHPLPAEHAGSMDPLTLARFRARSVMTVQQRDHEQAQRRSRAS
jgi:hypothetical protein